MRLPIINERITELLVQENLHLDLEINNKQLENQSQNQVLDYLDGYLCELKESQIRDGLHVFGNCPSGRQLRDLIIAIARHPNRHHSGLTRAIAKDLNWDFDPLTYNPIQTFENQSIVPCRNVGDAIELVEEYAAAVVEQSIENLTPSYRTPLFLLKRGERNKTPFSSGTTAEGNKANHQTPLSLTRRGAGGEVIADRAYNGLNLARAILGEKTVKAVKVDPDSPNRQITFLRSECTERIICDRQLISIVKNRATENTADGRFVATEVFKQLFKGGSRPYINSVESTTAYRKLSTSSISEPAIKADQVTAVYLSYQDPNYFKAINKQVALYKYRL